MVRHLIKAGLKVVALFIYTIKIQRISQSVQAEHLYLILVQRYLIRCEIQKKVQVDVDHLIGVRIVLKFDVVIIFAVKDNGRCIKIIIK